MEFHLRLVLLAAALLANSTFARAQSNGAQCFNSTVGQNPAVQLYASSQMSLASKVARLGDTCQELDPKWAYSGFRKPETLANGLLSSFAGLNATLRGVAISSFATLDGSDVQRDFKRQLDVVKTIPDRLERIRRVYLLVHRFMGKYDFASGGKAADSSGYGVGTFLPGNLLDQAHTTGSAGICRHQSALLYWSLMQVARAPGSRSPGLGPNDFSVEIETSYRLGHAWVRVNLPHPTPRGMAFDEIDLDITNYGPEPAFLLPRLTAMSPAQQIVYSQNCQRALSCLRESAARDGVAVDSPTSAHDPRAPARPGNR